MVNGEGSLYNDFIGAGFLNSKSKVVIFGI
jgi:hypothetical protein